MTKNKTILFPTDFSESAAYAFRYAQKLAHRLEAAIELIHVYHIPLHLMDVLAPTKLKDLDPVLREQLERDLREFAERNTREKMPITYKLRVGIPTQEILEEANKLDVIMIIMGTMGVSGLQRLLMGSVAEQVVRLSSQPVLTVRSRGSD
ncbi:MAG: universal stress protein [Deltaproteobacteria bacterium]|nr:universal stress protein [Deltaproteobacteria bacterium]